MRGPLGGQAGASALGVAPGGGGGGRKKTPLGRQSGRGGGGSLGATPEVRS